MGIFDSAKDKAEEYMRDNPDKVEEYSDKGLDHASDALDNATGNKYSEHIRKGRDMADERIGNEGH